MSGREILLVGAGAMAIEYARILKELGRDLVVLGRGQASAARFEEATGTSPSTGALTDQLAELDRLPEEAIVTVNAMHLAEVTKVLVDAGCSRVLVEKPAALDEVELRSLVEVANATGAEIRIGYNRRFLSSVVAARQMIAEDGGVLSVKFDFSEPSRRIATLGKPQRELDTWFFGNSSHVVDLAFSLAGGGETAAGAVSGGVKWNPSAGVFAGYARAEGGALLSWHANWIGPGRWGLEVITSERRLILRPLERLVVQDHSSFEERPVDIDLGPDEVFKPGLMRQVQAFLTGAGVEHLPSIHEHARNWRVYDAIRTGSPFSRPEGDPA